MSNDVLVLTEHVKGEMSEHTFELLGLARKVASTAGGRVIAVLLGWKAEAMASQVGAADEVLYLEHEGLAQFSPDAWSSVLVPLVRQQAPRLTLLAMSPLGLDLAGPLSATLELPLVAFAQDVSIQDSRTVVTSRPYGGKAFVESEFSGPGIVAVMTGVLDPRLGRSDRQPPIQKLTPELKPAEVRVNFRGLVEPPAGDVDIARQEVLVAVGRGIQQKENLPVAEELAQLLGGALCASRPVVDQGWLPRTRQVGKSGVKVKPKLYLALGISGAPEHAEGMKDAELIVAVNTDPSAPIFEVAHYGVVGDLLDIVPAIVDKLRAIKG
jgi:electron transfer flavoprotein alpha subunit